MRFLSVLAVCLSLFSLPCLAEETATAILSPKFKTLKIQRDGDMLAPPVIGIASGDRIVVSFDEIADDYSELQYRLIHCNADWQPSRLLESEYLDGFNLADIDDYAFSSNTFVHYVNYRLEIPSEKMKPLVAGNYLLEVFSRYEPDETLLRARFQVVSGGAVIGGHASGRTDRGINSGWQQLSFAVNLQPGLVANPYSDLIVTVEQNGRPETLRTIRQPLRADGNHVVYESTPDLIFPAGNEYRRFETVRTDYPGMGVDSVRFEGSNHHAYLFKAFDRASHEYVFDRTQRGRFVVDEYNSTDPNLGADYVTVHFALDFPQLMDGDIFVEGELSNHSFTDANKMRYNPDKGIYELQIPLKQGSYNYQYVARTRGSKPQTDAGIIEGNFSETCNEYNVCVYHRSPISRGDILLGTATIISE